jgi:hypothetical protein
MLLTCISSVCLNLHGDVMAGCSCCSWQGRLSWKIWSARVPGTGSLLFWAQLFELIYGCKVCSLSAIQVFVCGKAAGVRLQFCFPLLLLAFTFIQFGWEVAPMFDCVHVSHLHRTWIWLDIIWRSDALQTSISQLHCPIALLTLCRALAMFSVWFLRCHCDLVDSW